MRTGSLAVVLVFALAGCDARVQSDASVGDSGVADGATLDGAVRDSALPDCGTATRCERECTDLMNDPNNCGGCGNTCVVPNATAACVSGSCEIGVCDPGFYDRDRFIANGCEHQDECVAGATCVTSCGSDAITVCDSGTATCPPLAEQCNAVDDNCDGSCDEGAIGGCRVGVYRANGMGHLYTTMASVAMTAPFSVERANYFYLYTEAHEDLRPLFRCRKSDGRMLLTTQTNCEMVGPGQEMLGFISPNPVCGSTPLYRLYKASINNHFYTISATERDNAIDNLGYVLQTSPGHVWTGP